MLNFTARRIETRTRARLISARVATARERTMTRYGYRGRIA
jgi:uncharacterized DUF497 family protein